MELYWKGAKIMNDEMKQNNFNDNSEGMNSIPTPQEIGNESQQPNFILKPNVDAMDSSNVTVETGTYDANEMKEIRNEEVTYRVPDYDPMSSYYMDNQVVDSTPKKEKKKGRRATRFFKKSIAFVSAAALFGVIAGACFQGVAYLSNKEPKSNQLSVALKPFNEFDHYDNAENNDSSQNGTVVPTNSNSAVIATDVSDVVANVMPAIVAINCTTTMTEYDFFGRQFESEVSGSGSGIIIGQNDDELLIATNNHVVEGAKALEIVFADDTKALATIRGTEPNFDLAVVTVKMEDLSKDTQNSIRIATLGNSDLVKTGEMAIAIGNALGYGQSVTVGYISALNREVTTENATLNLLQTDAAINPGNSGGALINAHGEIIGINSVKYASTDVEGIGYAIPISEAIPIINELMNREDLAEDEMGYLGITGKNIDASFANAFNMPTGISVYEVGEGSAAQAAGIRKGDIIVGMNGKKIETMQDLQRTLSYTRGGTKVTINLKVLENGEYIEKDVEVTLGFRNK